MAKTPGVQQTPWIYQADDYLDRALVITVNFNNASRVLSGATIVRDPGCLYAKIYFGLGPDGTPDTTSRQFAVPEGTTNISKAQLNSGGLTTIEDILAGQVTAGP